MEKHNHINYICIELLFIPFQLLLVLRNATQFPMIYEILTTQKDNWEKHFERNFINS